MWFRKSVLICTISKSLPSAPKVSWARWLGILIRHLWQSSSNHGRSRESVVVMAAKLCTIGYHWYLTCAHALAVNTFYHVLPFHVLPISFCSFSESLKKAHKHKDEPQSEAVVSPCRTRLQPYELQGCTKDPTCVSPADVSGYRLDDTWPSW